MDSNSSKDLRLGDLSAGHVTLGNGLAIENSLMLFRAMDREVLRLPQQPEVRLFPILLREWNFGLHCFRRLGLQRSLDSSLRLFQILLITLHLLILRSSSRMR